MSEVKRFEMEKEYSLDINIVPTEYPDGSFVHYDDYAALQEQLTQRDAQIAALEEAVRVQVENVVQANSLISQLRQSECDLEEQVENNEAQIAALTAENVALKSPELQELLRLVECMGGDYCDGNYGHSHGWIRHIVTQQNEYQDKFGDTPYGIASGSKYLVTDAAANALRAEGFERAIAELKDLAARSKQEAPKAAEQTHADALYLMTFANQLREGK